MWFKTTFIAVAYMSLVSCSEHDFAGGNERKREQAANSSPNGNNAVPGNQTNGMNPGTSNVPGSNGTIGPNGTVMGPNGTAAGIPGTPGGPAISQTPSILDTLGNNGTTPVKKLPDVQIAQPTPSEVVFGGDKVFHIGDNAYSQDSACASEIQSYSLKGLKYYFEFEVVEPQTMVEINVARVCGIDYQGSNVISLQAATAASLERQPLAKGAVSAVLTPRVLEPGKYLIVVESNQAGLLNNPISPLDYDDFIVGAVRVKGNKTIRPGSVGAN